MSLATTREHLLHSTVCSCYTTMCGMLAWQRNMREACLAAHSIREACYGSATCVRHVCEAHPGKQHSISRRRAAFEGCISPNPSRSSTTEEK